MSPALPLPYGLRYVDALGYAAMLHADQCRKGGTVPYATHLLAVSALVWEDGGREDQAIAALLHDAAEDQGGRPRLEEIRGRFGDAVADMVAACTDAWEEPKPAWGPRKRAYVAQLADAPADALLVIAADKLHNATSMVQDHAEIGDAVWHRFAATPEEISWYYRAVHTELARRIPAARAVRRLGTVVAELEACAGVARPAAPTPAPA
ncbi:MAG: rsh 2 [Acidimicrobiales bacterium]|nr:rsh 2 [Acidimicrobiales bacterium]